MAPTVAPPSVDRKAISSLVIFVGVSSAVRTPDTSATATPTDRTSAMSPRQSLTCHWSRFRRRQLARTSTTLQRSLAARRCQAVRRQCCERRTRQRRRWRGCPPLRVAIECPPAAAASARSRARAARSCSYCLLVNIHRLALALGVVPALLAVDRRAHDDRRNDHAGHSQGVVRVDNVDERDR